MSLILAFSMTQLEVNRDQELVALDDNGRRVSYTEALETSSDATMDHWKRFPDAYFVKVSELRDIAVSDGNNLHDIISLA